MCVACRQKHIHAIRVIGKQSIDLINGHFLFLIVAESLFGLIMSKAVELGIFRVYHVVDFSLLQLVDDTIMLGKYLDDKSNS